MENYDQLTQKFLSSPDVKEHNPLTYLITPAEKTNIANVYKNSESPYDFDPHKKLIIDIFGPSGAGKDTITRLPDNSIADITIATSRSKREGEPEGTYKWMRGKQEDESTEEYFN